MILSALKRIFTKEKPLLSLYDEKTINFDVVETDTKKVLFSNRSFKNACALQVMVKQKTTLVAHGRELADNNNN